jgi:hypothetical protein
MYKYNDDIQTKVLDFGCGRGGDIQKFYYKDSKLISVKFIVLLRIVYKHLNNNYFELFLYNLDPHDSSCKIIIIEIFIGA